MLPEFKCKRGTAFTACELVLSGLNLTTALNCESIRPIFRQVSGFTVAQQPMICTWFLFNSITFAGDAHPKMTIKVKNEIAKIGKFREVP